MRTSSVKIVPGQTTFRYPMADSNPLFKVTRARGRGVWEAIVVDEPVEIEGIGKVSSDHAGTVRVFTTQEIRHKVGFQGALKRSIDESEAWYESLRVGQTIHYDNGFQQWVRCVVVMAATVHNAKPHKCLKPLALCGNWSKYDLPRRLADGSVHTSYHVKQIAEGTCFEPHFGSIFESGRSRAKDDPSKLPALDLSIPALSDAETASAKLWLAVREAQAALASDDDTGRPARERLEATLRVIQGALQ